MSVKGILRIVSNPLYPQDRLPLYLHIHNVPKKNIFVLIPTIHPCFTYISRNFLSNPSETSRAKESLLSVQIRIRLSMSSRQGISAERSSMLRCVTLYRTRQPLFFLIPSGLIPSISSIDPSSFPLPPSLPYLPL
jgi:hypothetical protein